MSQEHHRHHLFHRHKDEDEQNVGSGEETYVSSEPKASSYTEQGAYGSSGYDNPTDSAYNTGTGGTYGTESAGGGAYGSSAYNTTETGYGEQVTDTTVGYGRTVTDGSQDDYEKAKKEEKHHKRLEHVGELGAVAAGGYALYEKHEAKKDPEHAHRHKIEEEVAAAAAVGAGGYAFHEHHEKKESKEEEEESGGKHHRHHLF